MKARFLPDDHEPRDIYKLLIGLVVPRPIGWIGSIAPDGAHNLAPFSFFNAVAATPPTVLFSTVRPGGRHKDTLHNVESTGEFSVNIVSRDLAEAMNVTSGSYPPDVDEFAIAGLTAVPGTKIRAPMVAEAPANLECTVSRIVPIGDDGPLAASVVIGEVIAVHVQADLVEDHRIDQAGLDAIGRMGGPLYTATTDLFRLDRPE